MNIWIDAQLSPHIAQWIEAEFKIETHAVKELGLRDSSDKEIFFEAKKANAIILTKDIDFSHLVDIHGSPPKIIWITCGNTSNKRLKEILTANLLPALRVLEDTYLVEIS